MHESVLIQPAMLTGLPASGLVPVLLVGFIGLLLWLAGYRILRAGIAGLCFLIGLAVGWIVIDAFGQPVEPWFAGCVAGILLALIGAFASKLIITIAMTAVLALAAPLATLSLASVGVLAPGGSEVSRDKMASEKHGLFDLPTTDEANGEELAESGSAEMIDDAMNVLLTDQQSRIDEVQSKLEALQDSLPEIDAATQGHIDQVRNVAADTFSAIWSAWSEADSRMRRTLLVSAVVGGLFGLLCGTLSPRFSGSVVTSLAGSLIVLACAWIILMRVEVPQGSWLPESLVGWTVCWISVAIIGLCVQWTFRQRPADRAA